MRVLSFFMKILWFILNLAASFFKEPAMQTSQTRSRKLPLHTCVVSVLSSSRRAYTKAQQYNGLSGLLFRKSAWLVAVVDPYARDIQNRCLSILTLVDDRILASESMIEKNVPAATLVFDKFDDLIRATETFPDKAEWIVSRAHFLIHKVPFLDRASLHLTPRLESWLCELGWGNSAHVKEIQVDSRPGCIGEENKHCQAGDEGSRKDRCLTVKAPSSGSKMSNNCVIISPKGTFKQVLLEKWNQEDHGHPVESPKGDYDLKQKTLLEDSDSKESGQKKQKEAEIARDMSEEGSKRDDRILDLFDMGWHASPM